jgi:hypothetical protein
MIKYCQNENPLVVFFCPSYFINKISNQNLIETKKVLLCIKLSKLVKNGANIFYLLTHSFGYLLGIKGTIGIKKLKIGAIIQFSPYGIIPCLLKKKCYHLIWVIL